MPNNVQLEPSESESEFEEMLSLYVFGLLDAGDAAQVERRLTSEPRWQSELRAFQDTLSALADPAPVPAGSAERLLKRVQAEAQQHAPQQQHPQPASSSANLPMPQPPLSEPPVTKPLVTRPRPAYLGPLLALGLAAAVAAVLLLPHLSSSPEQQLANYQTQAGAVTTQLNTKDGQKLGTAVRLQDGRAFVLLAKGAPAGKAYQAWQVLGAAPESLGVFNGRSFLTAPLSGKVTFAVSVEPPSGSAQPTTTPILAQVL
ncbi:anti-sigma factor [Deinococcus detaillensis]|nr:anti-sigma factor [Deinococcus detaillensis]